MRSITTHPFGALPDGRDVERIDLANGDTEISILTYGGIIASWRAPNAAEMSPTWSSASTLSTAGLPTLNTLEPSSADMPIGSAMELPPRRAAWWT